MCAFDDVLEDTWNMTPLMESLVSFIDRQVDKNENLRSEFQGRIDLRRAASNAGEKSGFCLSRLKVCDIVEDQIVEDLVLYNLAKFGKTKMKT